MKVGSGSDLSRREFLGAAGAAFLLARRGKSLEKPSNRPNLVFVLADQLRHASCGWCGDSRAQTPNLDALARQGVDFTNAVSGHPVCAAYRASLLTGKYTTSTGMVINELRMNPNSECFAHVLNRAGYNTAYIGKWHLWANELGNHDDPKNSFTPPGPYRLGFDGFWAGYGFHHDYFRGYYHTNSPEKIPIEGYEPDFQADLAIEQVGKLSRQDKPFALFLSFGTPHDPWGDFNVPKDWLEKFGDTQFGMPPNYRPDNDPYSDAWGRFKDADARKLLPWWMRVYYAMTANLDFNVGRLLKAIRANGIENDTIFVFTSDHGEMFGAQGRRAKNIFYDEAVRVPFVLRWPAKVPAGLRSDACLNTPDILPTLLSLMGLRAPAKSEGADLSHCALGTPGDEPEAAFMQNTGACASWEDGYEWRGLRSKRYTYAIYRRDRRELLFDNSNDPYQMRDLGYEPSQRETMDSFRDMLKKRMNDLDDTFEACTWYRDNWTRDRIITRIR